MTEFHSDLGDGVEIRTLRLDEVPAVFALIDRERDRLGRWLPWADEVRTVEDERRWLERVLASERDVDGTGIFVGGEYAGGIGLTMAPFGVDAEIGYWIGSSYEGRGIVTRACRALIDHAFDRLGVHRVTIRAATENVRSRSIPERLGFTREGVLREAERGSGGFHDLVVYGLLEHEWREGQAKRGGGGQGTRSAI